MKGTAVSELSVFSNEYMYNALCIMMSLHCHLMCDCHVIQSEYFVSLVCMQLKLCYTKLSSLARVRRNTGQKWRASCWYRQFGVLVKGGLCPLGWCYQSAGQQHSCYVDWWYPLLKFRQDVSLGWISAGIVVTVQKTLCFACHS